MAKLYPPYIEGKLPAQTGTVLRIPFRFNRAVSKSDIEYVVARIKTTTTDKWLGTFPNTTDLNDIIQQGPGYEFDSVSQRYVTEVKVTDTDGNFLVPLNVGQYYKIQLAFYNPDYGGIGYFSDVGIFKYTEQPRIYIAELEQNGKNANQYEYIGVYSQQGKDPTEKEYTYQFDVRAAETGELIDSSGLQLHNSELDESNYESRDKFALTYELAEGRNYTIQYTVNTTNNLTAQSPAYLIQRTDVIPINLNGTLKATNDYDNGVMKITLESTSMNKPAKLNRGYVISRASDKDGYSTWYDLMKFTVSAYSAFPEILGTDYTVEQGVAYKYGLQEYQNSGMRTKRMEIAEPVIADFEDSFLYDGSRQFKIRFNAKVSSFKNTLLESKIDTIGGKHPFFFRNGNVKYKEFPINGLISYLGDQDGYFMSDAELGFFEQDATRNFTPSALSMSKIRVRSTQVDTLNLLAERNFKMKALEWLTDGQPKLFRSPGEGNYIVRLMNVSMSPNDTVGRMLHTFSAQAYEIADYTFQNLVEYNFLHDVEYNNMMMRYLTIELKNKDYQILSFQTQGGAYHAVFREVPYGTKILLNFLNGKGDQEIMIGNTGTYEVNIFDYPLMSVTFKSTLTAYGLSGYLDYGHYAADRVEDFSEVRNVVFSDLAYQHYGESTNIVNDITDIKMKVGYVYFLRIEQREIRVIYTRNGKYYADEGYRSEIRDFASSVIYYVKESGTYFDGGDNLKRRMTPSYSYTLGINNGPTQNFDLAGPKSIILDGLDSLQTLRMDNGLVCDLIYQRQEYIYGVEEDDTRIVPLKDAWVQARDYLLEVQGDESKPASEVAAAQRAEQNAYDAFIQKLTEVLGAV